MRTIAIVKYAFAVIGGGLVLGALFWANHVRSFIAQAAKVEGTVIALLASRSNDGGTTWKPVVRFTAADSAVIEFTSSSSSNPPSYAKGEKVEVLYRPDNPREASINGFFSLWGGPLIFGGIGAVFFLVGGGMIFAGRYSAKRAQYLRANGVPVQARFQGVELNKALTVNGRHPFRVVAHWQNPATSELHVFYSQNLWFDPSDYIKNSDLTVYVEQGNPKKYVVDVAFLPKLASLAVAAIALCLVACGEPPPAEQSIVSYERSDRGALQVKGDTHDWYSISQDGRSVGSNPPLLGTTTELEPGDYEVSVNKTVRKVRIEKGKKMVLLTGTLMVQGSGGDWWYPEQGGERRTAVNPPTLGHALALFSGTYTVQVYVRNHAEKLSDSAQVAAGRKTVLSR